MVEQLDLLPRYLTAHLQLSLLALVLGVGISLPLGLWTTRHPRMEATVLGAASVLQTIPGLALLALMVPSLALLADLVARVTGDEFSSIGFVPALIALTLYSVLPILRNTVTGIANLDPALVEAARGVGMTSGERMRLVELPLALPVIVAGVRTATVWVVGTATLATPVGATSLGNYIFSGLQTRNFTAVAVGSLAAAGLALTLDGLIRLLESALRRRSRRRSALAVVCLGALAAYSTGAAVAARWGTDNDPVRIGAKSFTEQYVLSEILAATVRSTGTSAVVLPSLGSTVAFDALRSGDLDVYVDYSGTIWATIMNRTDLPEDRGRVLEEVEDFLLTEHGVVTVGSLGFENTYALAMRRQRAEELGVERISDLRVHAPRLAIGGDYEFFARQEWTALERDYELDFAEERSMDSALMYSAVAAGEVDVISAYSTDGRIAAFDLVLLRDDRGVIPPYDAILLTRAALIEDRPLVSTALEALPDSISAPQMQSLNWSVDDGGETPAAVAAAFLAERSPD